ncbi:hypothetical protein [Methylobacterium soli]|uniref:Uncharacterized protein n=1 Tax=Methylobacterium soli TaxID=553447 RepID=A0A6L3SRN4_9HYPH|nr:hypothetical protein [Methylobacterium soli]KAB1075458.1 hypothetical protein F6X53_25180 [Methylobacterium soli]GJE45444.1 hypothetical protein AEGHOMDF_4639 [Methylobacterium soli]
MDESPTLGELYSANTVTYRDLEAAIDAYMTGLQTFRLPGAEGFEVDVAAAVQANSFARYVQRRGDVTVDAKRAAVRTAILLARPEKR